MTARQEAEVRELRHQLTVFMMAGGMALALLEGSRRFSAHSGMSEWLRGGAIFVLFAGCLLSGVTMLQRGASDLRRAAAQRGAAQIPAHQRVSRPRAMFSVAFGAVLGVLVPGALLLKLLAS
ncbi:MAG: hypothetical protein RIT45_4280 [Pseudomonadota bacterium]|jgi:hypothetical protein